MFDEGVEPSRESRLNFEGELKPPGQSTSDMHFIEILERDLTSVDVVLPLGRSENCQRPNLFFFFSRKQVTTNLGQRNSNSLKREN